MAQLVDLYAVARLFRRLLVSVCVMAMVVEKKRMMALSAMTTTTKTRMKRMLLRCGGCHRHDAIAQQPLLTWQRASEWAAAVAALSSEDPRGDEGNVQRLFAR